MLVYKSISLRSSVNHTYQFFMIIFFVNYIDKGLLEEVLIVVTRFDTSF